MKHQLLIPALLLCGLGTAACSSEPASTTPDPTATSEDGGAASAELVSFKVSGMT